MTIMVLSRYQRLVDVDADVAESLVVCRFATVTGQQPNRGDFVIR